MNGNGFCGRSPTGLGFRIWCLGFSLCASRLLAVFSLSAGLNTALCVTGGSAKGVSLFPYLVGQLKELTTSYTPSASASDVLYCGFASLILLHPPVQRISGVKAATASPLDCEWVWLQFAGAADVDQDRRNFSFGSCALDPRARLLTSRCLRRHHLEVGGGGGAVGKFFY